MDPLTVIADRHDFFTRRDARSAGFIDREIAAMVRSGVWVRFRRGYYAPANAWNALDDRGRHLVRARAVLHALGEDVALSHVSGVVAHGITDWGLDLSRVHVTRLDGAAGRIEGDVVHHEGLCIDGDVVEVDGMRVVRAERSVLEAGSLVGPEAALAMFDNGLHLQRFDHDRLTECHQLLQFWPRMRQLHIPVRMADGRVESVGESRGNWWFRQGGVPAPVPQFAITNAAGEVIATCDWGWPEHNCYGEFDGRLKYGRLLQPGQSPGDVVFAEKQREDQIREQTGGKMMRLVWSDYDRPRLLAQRALRMLGLAS